MARASATERYNLYNNLTCVVKGLENEYTTIDLRNESCITGKIKFVDGYMNIDMENVIYCDPMGSNHSFKHFFVHSRLIRFVHIPKHLPATNIVKHQIVNAGASGPSLITDSFKVRKAKQYHKEIVEEISHKK